MNRATLPSFNRSFLILLAARSCKRFIKEKIKLRVRTGKGWLCDIVVSSDERVQKVHDILESLYTDEVLMIFHRGRILLCESTLEDNMISNGTCVLALLRKNPLHPNEVLYLVTLMKKLNPNENPQKDVWCKTGAILKDLAKDQASAQYLVKPFMIGMLVFHLNASHSDHHFKEICLSVIGNMASHECLIKRITSTLNLVETLIQQLFLPDPKCLIQVFSLLNSVLRSSESVSWVKALDDDAVWNQISDIVHTGSHPVVLEEVMEFSLALVSDRNKEGTHRFLPKLFDIGYIVLRLSPKEEYTYCFIPGATLIAKILLARADLGINLAKDFLFLQGLFDIFSVMKFGTFGRECRDCLCDIFAEVLIHIQEEEMNSSTLYPYIRFLVKNKESIKEVVNFCQSHPPAQCYEYPEPVGDYQVVAMKKMVNILRRWMLISSTDHDISDTDVYDLLDIADMIC